ncbi:aminoglycoside phosphotransferase family protein [Aestuariirhabdus litorea]|uniref:Aminoglycoside phosphotransferase n=1 Tax=Aestuariirhabdus litorea TaxID=2528527 RepID=A0A3P3VUI4_9GAMM|nr:phosphotransferase [Aestuariirhabdus litorea]RRJ84423.1 aminoglycoside phosphotransferase [Aestuariirhabdus litorea]RWW97647.1 aminoglycoside phosphotransferase [Endozoicomonadaceae bacterium GTF-13]
MVEDNRQQARQEFMTREGWGAAEVEPLAADASFRRYFRLRRAGESCLLMDAPPPQEQILPFISIAQHLVSLGLRAPRVLASELDAGFALLEDFGDDTFTRLLARGEAEASLYRMAVDVLIQLHRHPAATELELPPYDEQALLREALLLVDWYYPALNGVDCPAEAVESYRAAWVTALAPLRAEPATLVLRDFHVDNLMRVGDGSSVAHCGLLDFQDALIGSPAYDLMSLLEDARRDVTPALQQALIDHYLTTRTELDAGQFMRAYRILAAQRHAKVAGIFVRLMVRDGKPIYLQHLPRVVALLTRNLEAPELAPVREWVARWMPNLGVPLVLAP